MVDAVICVIRDHNKKRHHLIAQLTDAFNIDNPRVGPIITNRFPSVQTHHSFACYFPDLSWLNRGTPVAIRQRLQQVSFCVTIEHDCVCVMSCIFSTLQIYVHACLIWLKFGVSLSLSEHKQCTQLCIIGTSKLLLRRSLRRWLLCKLAIRSQPNLAR